MPLNHCQPHRLFTAIFALWGLLAGLSSPLCAAEVQLAVAANFAAPMQEIAAGFARESGHRPVVSTGASGKFYAQIRHGAPFEVLLSADDEIPSRLVQEHLAVAGTQFTYALGRLVLWSQQGGLVDAQGQVLRRGGFRHLAIANPKTAPYGAAATEVLSRLGLLASLSPLFVQGENIAQTQQFVRSGNAELGFIALSQVFRDGQITEGSGWVVPASLHAPIRQDAVLLKAGQGKPAALAFLAYLKSESAQAVMRRYGYEFGPAPR